ncbi:MAG: hypothetical protein ABI670_07615 [Chloroflexota bacterium]
MIAHASALLVLQASALLKRHDPASGHKARRILNTRIIPVRAPIRERLISEARSRFGDEEYEQAHTLGQAMNLEDAISYAIAERNARS